MGCEMKGIPMRYKVIPRRIQDASDDSPEEAEDKARETGDGAKRTYSYVLMDYLARLYEEYCRRRGAPPNALMIPCSMLAALRAISFPFKFANLYTPDFHTFMDCEVIAVDEWDCGASDYSPRFFRRHDACGRSGARSCAGEAFNQGDSNEH